MVQKQASPSMNDPDYKPWDTLGKSRTVGMQKGRGVKIATNFTTFFLHESPPQKPLVPVTPTKETWSLTINSSSLSLLSLSVSSNLFPTPPTRHFSTWVRIESILGWNFFLNSGKEKRCGHFPFWVCLKSCNRCKEGMLFFGFGYKVINI